MFSVERDSLPFILQRMSGDLDDASIEEAAAYMLWVAGLKRRLYAVVDCRTAKVPDSKGRARLAAAMRAAADLTAPEHNSINALVFESRLVAGALTALRWVVPAKAPEANVATFKDALAFLERHARADGVSVPDAYRALVLRGDL